ncbi:prepilin-type N-terminal cleavage/methylation domain-containing protein [Massilia forsythiae]|uniref:Type II secretion system protein H n=1 Tax=Massilia forsythiae TaxID=2728020 RepID=A0A7Z2ZR31_9BURK|nr:GspH/FimT family protein [Massilia forsythiae]QJD98674.1 prepilin-type N-terminal cleavage/methylation domain-containing protein [Massilia forsythiae]
MKIAAGKQSGLSLVELTLVLALAAVLLAAAAPNLEALLRTQQLKGAAGDLLAAIGMARSQALTRGLVVRLAPRDAAQADWTQGWRLFVDRDGDGLAGPADDLIVEHGALPGGMAAAFAFTNPAPPYYIAYNGAGRSCSDGGGNGNGAARYGTLSLFHGGAIRRIKINMLGRARLCDPARDASCDGASAPP